MEDGSLKDVALACWLDIVYGGQDTREYSNSLRIIRQALEHVPERIKYKPTKTF